MDGYMYQADLYCAECAQEIMRALSDQGTMPKNPEDESSFDSDDYPKGPIDMAYEESDSPSHCAKCQWPLENPLTSDGEEYVRAAVFDYYANGSGDKDTIEAWQTWYEYLFDADEVPAPD